MLKNVGTRLTNVYYALVCLYYVYVLAQKHKLRNCSNITLIIVTTYTIKYT